MRTMRILDPSHVSEPEDSGFTYINICISQKVILSLNTSPKILSNIYSSKTMSYRTSKNNRSISSHHKSETVLSKEIQGDCSL